MGKRSRLARQRREHGFLVVVKYADTDTDGGDVDVFGHAQRSVAEAGALAVCSEARTDGGVELVVFVDRVEGVLRVDYWSPDSRSLWASQGLAECPWVEAIRDRFLSSGGAVSAAALVQRIGALHASRMPSS